MSMRWLGMVLVAVLGWPAAAQRGGPPRGYEPPGVSVPKPEVIVLPSPNIGNRAEGVTVDTIVMHTTQLSLEDSLRVLTSGASGVSTHFTIDRNGDIYEMVDLRARAFHATYYNSRSVGIEMVGDANDPDTWTQENLAALYDLSAWLVAVFPDIPIEHPMGNAYDYPGDFYDEPGLVAHGQIQPWNRTDPGPYFPWDEYVSEVEARVPEPGVGLAMALGWMAVGMRRGRAGTR
ncbi:MAG: N-acetylmuramoyl-L-alanine amidase [Planctomycetota bacterium]